VEELEQEIEKEHLATPILEKVSHFMNLKFPLEIRVDELFSEQIEQGKEGNSDQIHKLLGEISELDKSVSPLLKQQQQIFNPLWGEVMRTGIEESYFAYQVDRFACVYMAKLSDLTATSPRAYFRSWRRPMAHDFKVGE